MKFSDISSLRTLQNAGVEIYGISSWEVETDLQEFLKSADHKPWRSPFMTREEMKVLAAQSGTEEL